MPLLLVPFVTFIRTLFITCLFLVPFVFYARFFFFSNICSLTPLLSLFRSHSAPFSSLHTFPLSFSYCINIPTTLIPSLLSFNYAIWRYREPASCTHGEKDNDWRAKRLADLAHTLYTRLKSVKKLVKTNIDLSLEGHDVIVGSLLPNDLVCYTDGSASPNPGPAGSGACIFSVWDSCVTDLGLSIGISTNNLGELVAIGLVLRELLCRPQTNHDRTRVFLFTDSLYASSAVQSTKPPSTHSDTIRVIRALLVQVSILYTVSFHWIRGHMEVGGNERADRIAKSFARLSVAIPVSTTRMSFTAHRTVSSWPLGLISVPFEAFLVHLPKAYLPTHSQSSGDPVDARVASNEPSRNILTIPTVPFHCGLHCSPSVYQPPVVQCRWEPVNDHTVDVQSLVSLDTSVTSSLPILNDFVQGSTCLSVFFFFLTPRQTY